MLFDSPSARVDFPASQAVVDQRRRFFAQGEEGSRPFIFADSSGFVGIAVRNGSAARVLGASVGTPAILTLADNKAV